MSTKKKTPNLIFSLSGDPNDPHRYDDMISLPNHKSPRHPHMTMENRAAQFSPFAALTGYEEVIEETGRLTQTRVELTEEIRQEINRMLLLVKTHEAKQPAVRITYFLPDSRKEGGAYLTEECRIRRVDEYRKELVLVDRRTIPFSDIFEITEIN